MKKIAWVPGNLGILYRVSPKARKFQITNNGAVGGKLTFSDIPTK